MCLSFFQWMWSRGRSLNSQRTAFTACTAAGSVCLRVTRAVSTNQSLLACSSAFRRNRKPSSPDSSMYATNEVPMATAPAPSAGQRAPVENKRESPLARMPASTLPMTMVSASVPLSTPNPTLRGENGSHKMLALAFTVWYADEPGSLAGQGPGMANLCEKEET